MPRQFPDRSSSAITRRRLLASLAAFSLGLHGSANATEFPLVGPDEPFRFPDPLPDVISQVTPKAGTTTGVAFGDSIQEMIAAGVIDPTKLRELRNGLPAWVERLLAAPSDDSILFSEATAPYLLNLLWALGLANKAAFNAKSPIGTVRIPAFASTGGWALGRAENGYVYFNQVDAIRMTDRQQAMVLEVATTTFRPCCNNSTFFQDCNHGSALLGLLELAAPQGVTLQGLYGLARIANSYWFPAHYAKTALYFAHFRRTSWSDLPPQLVLSADYSSLTGWRRNVSDRLLRANVRLPGETRSGQACGL